ncbi:hypothetical protein [Polyangium mundeleinium]|uniref:Glycosyltransferase RgtA/B/C/D-like domain-containing protein n=1 Tax=Polyangium mundeleinium TaxID=2995306 RepID=A0ABT5EGS0_9BACT|nr:hypothetical protein [Polyangium mundeleinium]MDC0741020.1 hypothetical protein [Polyangium mundeleinium]
MRTHLRGALATTMLVAGIALFGWVVHRHYPIPKWLFWRYAGYWLGALVVGTASYGIGHVLVERVFRLRLPLLEHAVFSFVLGIFGFETTMCLVGAAQGYRKPAFYAVPLVLLAAVALPLRRHVAHVRRVLARTARTRPALGWSTLATVFGVLGLGMVYFLVLTPHNIQFDARWKHMAIAENWVAHGGLYPAAEGWVFSARPHFTSYLYAWAFLAPGRLFDKMVLSAHLEFLIFVVTTVLGIPALVRRLVPKADPRWVWAARFVFPGVFLYDSSLSGGADHAGAMYAIPIALCLFRVLRDFDPRFVVLLGLFIGGAGITKETIVMMLGVAPLLLVGGKIVVVLVQSLRGKATPELRRRALLSPLLLAAAGLVATSPLWLKNFLFYGDPVYPVFSKYLHAHPLTDQALYRFKYGYAEGLLWKPTRDLKGLRETLQALFTWSFSPNDWPKFHRTVPVIGSLFTLLLACLPFLKNTKRLWILVFWIHLGIFGWYSIHHQDRYLQGLMPLMAAVTVAIALSLWRSFGVAARGALGMLVGLQLIWGGDVYFIQTHGFVKTPLKSAIDLLSAGFEKKYDDRFDIQDGWQDVGNATPKGSRLLVHIFLSHHFQLGTNRETILDMYLFQYGIEYGAAKTPEGVRQMVKDLGATHVFVAPDKKADGMNSIAADILFWDFVRYLTDRKSVNEGVLGGVPDKPIDVPFRDTVAVLSCSAKAPPNGLYKLSDLRTLPYGPDNRRFGKPLRAANNKDVAAAFLPMAEFVVVEDTCYDPKSLPPDISRSYDLLVERREWSGFRGMDIFRRKAHLPAMPVPPGP